MIKHLRSWLAVTGISVLSVGLLAALGLSVYLIVRIIGLGLGQTLTVF